MSILLNQFSAVLHNLDTAKAWIDPLNVTLEQFQINTKFRMSAFLAQVLHESANLTHLTENLNYSEQALISTWPTRFNSSNAKAYARQPEKIANKVYCDRLGNGNEESGDGWKFRGRGPLQLTGKGNYSAFSKRIYGDERLLETPDLVALDRQTGLLSAAWFWECHKLNAMADAQNINGISKAINGGTIGLEDRAKRYTEIMRILEL